MALALLSQRKMRRFSNKIFAASEASLRLYDLIEFLEQKCPKLMIFGAKIQTSRIKKYQKLTNLAIFGAKIQIFRICNYPKMN